MRSCYAWIPLRADDWIYVFFSPLLEYCKFNVNILQLIHNYGDKKIMFLEALHAVHAHKCNILMNFF